MTLALAAAVVGLDTALVAGHCPTVVWHRHTPPNDIGLCGADARIAECVTWACDGCHGESVDGDGSGQTLSSMSLHTAAAMRDGRKKKEREVGQRAVTGGGSETEMA